MSQFQPTKPDQEPEEVAYEYGVMSSKFEVKAKNKLTAYAAMLLHYREAPHLVVIYSPESSKSDCWTSFNGKVSERLDEIFNGPGSFDKYLQDHVVEIRAAYKSIKRLV